MDRRAWWAQSQDMTEQLTSNRNATRSYWRILKRGNMIQFVF